MEVAGVNKVYHIVGVRVIVDKQKLMGSFYRLALIHLIAMKISRSKPVHDFSKLQLFVRRNLTLVDYEFRDGNMSHVTFSNPGQFQVGANAHPILYSTYNTRATTTKQN